MLDKSGALRGHLNVVAEGPKEIRILFYPFTNARYFLRRSTLKIVQFNLKLVKNSWSNLF